MTGTTDRSPPVGAEPVWIDSGTFWMGSDRHHPEEAPAHEVTVEGFWIDPTPVTNAEFAAFATDSGYTTVAERPLNPADFPGCPGREPGARLLQRSPNRPCAVDVRHPMKRMIRTLFVVAAAAVTVAAAGATPADAMGNTKWSDIELASSAPTTGAWVPKIELGTF